MDKKDSMSTIMTAKKGMVWCAMAVVSLTGLMFVETSLAHGERAQMPQLRMRTVNWFDVSVTTNSLQVSDEVVVSGSFMPSKYWPDHVESIEKMAFLNIGVPGPAFVRLESTVNDVPMIRSTSFKKGELYHFKIRLKARKDGRYHVHPIINVLGAGPMIGPGVWVEVSPAAASEPFENKVTTLLGKTIDLENYGLENVFFWSALWFSIGLAWFVYWLTKCPIIIPRFKKVGELGHDADEIITPTDRRVTGIFLTATLLIIVGSYMYTQDKYPITTPLQTGKVHVSGAEQGDVPLEVKMVSARYRIPGRSFRIELEVKNSGESPVTVGELTAGNLRFINSEVLSVKPKDEDDLIAPDALRVEGGPVMPGETKVIVVYADDALWETQRMTTMIASPDAVVAALLFFFDKNGNRYPIEIGGPMIPEFG